jgi:putative membrane protein
LHRGWQVAPFRRTVLRLRQVLALLPLASAAASSSATSAAEAAAAASLEEHLDGLSKCAGGCFRLLTSPIPPTYQRHVTRALLVWLAALPLALPRELSLWPLLFAVVSTAYLTLGIDEIAIQHEESFAVLPLHELALGTAKGVAAALSARPPPLPPSICPSDMGQRGVS